MLQELDTILFHGVNHAPHSHVLDAVMQTATLIGVGWVQATVALTLILAGLALRMSRISVMGYAGLVSYASSGLAVQIAKLLWDRPRPLLVIFDVRLVGEPLFGHSFPSGHTTTTFALAVTLSRIAPRSRWVLLTLACLTGISRIYLGVHYPLDVVYGALIGSLIGWAASMPFVKRCSVPVEAQLEEMPTE